ncbi:hypothetical protein Bbelb_070530 [Branchiostoma belcheri]|nr:hypothetical protein Bbelb_070530 [Branchiostoma belcheri]
MNDIYDHTVEIDTVEKNTVEKDTFEVDTVEIDTVEIGTVEIDTVEIDTVEIDTVEIDTVEIDTVEIDTVEIDTVEIDTVEIDTVEIDTVEIDTVEIDTDELHRLWWDHVGIWPRYAGRGAPASRSLTSDINNTPPCVFPSNKENPHMRKSVGRSNTQQYQWTSPLLSPKGYEMEMGTTLRSGKSMGDLPSFHPTLQPREKVSIRPWRVKVYQSSMFYKDQGFEWMINQPGFYLTTDILPYTAAQDRECTMMGKAPPGVLMFLLVVLKMMGTAEAACSCSSSVCDFSSQNLTCVPHVLGLPTDIKICDCSSQNLTSVPQHLPTDITQFNQLTSLPISSYDILKSNYDINIDNNPWQCCRMVDMRFKMTGSYPFENQITCSQPDIIHGQKLIDISPEDLMSYCEDTPIVIKA